jgi:urease gamma subunit
MKLHELSIQPQSKNIKKVLENRLGQQLSLDTLSPAATRHMLRRVRSLVKEARQTPGFHNSERNASYLKLVMMEQALSTHLHEVGEIAMAIDTSDPKTKQIMQKAANGGTLNPEEQKTMTAIALMKKEGAKTGMKRMVKESELQTAQVVLASQDMLDRVQKMTEDISEMQFKDLPALVDSIRNDMGTEQATAYQSQASAALGTLLGAVQQGKTQLEAAQGTITGQAPQVPGDADAGLGGDMGDDSVDADALSATGMDDGDVADVGIDVDADLEVGSKNTKALGRERR